MLLHCAMAFVWDVFGFRSGCGLVTCLRCKDTDSKIATYALAYVFRSSVRLYAIFFLCGKVYVWLLSRFMGNPTNIIDPESGRPLQLMGHSFRVLVVNGYYTAGRPDLRLLSGDAFSVCEIQKSVVIFIKPMI